MNKELTLEERKKVQLEMLDEIDSFCRKNNIKYSLAFGTLLGAIRHKGFIPWDDDVDIMMPIDDLNKFKETFRSDLLSYYDVYNCAKHSYPFSRLGHNGTYSKAGKIATNYGICIDLYIMVNLMDDEEELAKYFKEGEKWQFVRRQIKRVKSRLLQYLPIDIKFPFHRWVIKRLNKHWTGYAKYGTTNTYYVVAGSLNLRKKMTYDRDLFANLTEVDFENKKYYAIADWDYYLTLRYGDYMKLPPVEQRVPYHGGEYYWKEK